MYGYDVLIGSSFDFSPVDIMLDCAVDILLILREMFEQGSRAAAKNAGLGFSQVYSDPLGNPKQFKISFPSNYYWDPHAKDYFYGLAQTFIEIKDQKPITKCFHDFCEVFGQSRPPIRSNRASLKKKANYHWWRRQQRRFRR
jgi:hypothetical protein